MPEHKVASVDGSAELDVYRTDPTPALPIGAYGLRITVTAPERERLQLVVDRDAFAELLTGILAEDDSLRTTVEQALFVKFMKPLRTGEHPPTA